MLILPIILFFSVTAVYGQEGELRSQLVALHDKWFKAFDNHDPDTMNLIESRDMTLVMNDGSIIRLSRPREKRDTQSEPDLTRTLSNASVRQFGNSALLVGVVTSKGPRENSQAAETVSFVKVGDTWKINSVQWTDIAKRK